MKKHRQSTSNGNRSNNKAESISCFIADDTVPKNNRVSKIGGKKNPLTPIVLDSLLTKFLQDDSVVYSIQASMYVSLSIT